MGKESENKLWKNKQYMHLIGAQIVSSLGDWLDILALLALVAIKWDTTPIGVSGVMVCIAIPMITLGPFAGAISDKFDRKRIMIISDLIRCLVVLGFVVASSLWQIYLLLLIKSAFASLFVPAKNGKLKEIVHEKDIQQAMGISGMIDNSSKIIGPTLSGILVSFIGVNIAFFIDAATFVISAVFLLGVTNSTYQQAEKKEQYSRRSIFHQIIEGYVHLKQIPSLTFGLIGLSCGLLVLQIADSQIMILLRGIEGDPVRIAGYAMASSGAGMFIMSAILSKRNLNISLPTTMGLGVSIVGVGIVGAAIIVELSQLAITIVLPILFCIIGIAFTAVILPFNIAVQKETPVQLSGRVFGTINSITMLATIIGMVSGGILSEIIGVQATFFISGGSLIIVGFGALFRKQHLESRDVFAESNGGAQKKTAP
ncbi:MFS transporter [Aquibacillus rhizosphaerae]|uniref:MFS transporter n=1 Tax=Aquibacillus rhizosphaerae TaxID=3051431 RepID=A0ABT7L7K1_9BACI|nr:MFS transporter [Aquibacillus sp. LR5S19]MDL4841813.1 MFS transporter [Aquibacillus sp. LR5S19]